MRYIYLTHVLRSTINSDSSVQQAFCLKCLNFEFHSSDAVFRDCEDNHNNYCFCAYEYFYMFQ